MHRVDEPVDVVDVRVVGVELRRLAQLLEGDVHLAALVVAGGDLRVELRPVLRAHLGRLGGGSCAGRPCGAGAGGVELQAATQQRRERGAASSDSEASHATWRAFVSASVEAGVAGRDAARQPPLRAVLHAAGELAARGVDVLAARLADRRDRPASISISLEREDPRARARPELGAGERVERNQVELARDVADERDQLRAPARARR